MKRDIINPLKSFDFNTGNWAVYLTISRSDFEKFAHYNKEGKVFKDKDMKTLKQMQSEWNFVYTGGDGNC